jgi:hypothetical protein
VIHDLVIAYGEFVNHCIRGCIFPLDYFEKLLFDKVTQPQVNHSYKLFVFGRSQVLCRSVISHAKSTDIRSLLAVERFHRAYPIKHSFCSGVFPA